MSLRIAALVPVKDPGHGKSRLYGVLEPEERAVLNEKLAARTLDVCTEVFGAGATFVVSASTSIAALASARGMQAVAEARPADLNAALAAAGRAAMAAGADALLVVPTDLARLSAPALQAVVDALRSAGGCVLVPDRHGIGTNLMGLAPARVDLFRFGGHSLEKHQQAAREAGIAVAVHRDPRLALDLDLPEDLALWRGTGAA